MSKTRSQVRTRRPKKQSISKQIMNLSETKMKTEHCHHFMLNSVSNLVYSDSGIYIGGWTCTNKIVQGTANNERIGNSIHVSKIDYIFNVTAPVNSPDTVRILVIKDIAPKGMWPALADMFDDLTHNLTQIAPNCRHQYKIIHDAYIDVGAYLPVRTHKFTLKLGTDTRYVGVGPNLVDLENGAIYILVVSVNGINTSEVLQFWSTIYYKDL